MSTGKTLGIIAAIGAGIWFATSRVFNIKEAIDKLSVSNPRIKVNFAALTVALDVWVDINNPASVDIPFEYYAGSVLYAGSEIGKFNSNYQGQNVTLKQRSFTPVNFKVNINNLQTIWKLKGLLQSLASGNKDVDSNITIRSAIYAGGFDVPVNFVYSLKTQTVIAGISGRRKKLKQAPPLPPPPPIEVEELQEESNLSGFVYAV
jgi:hypothetical protein